MPPTVTRQTFASSTDAVRTDAIRHARITAEQLGLDLGRLIESAMESAYLAGVADGYAQRDAEGAEH